MKFKETTIFYDNSTKYNGIFKYLSNQTRQTNIHSSGVIEFSSPYSNPSQDYGLIFNIRDKQ